MKKIALRCRFRSNSVCGVARPIRAADVPAHKSGEGRRPFDSRSQVHDTESARRRRHSNVGADYRRRARRRTHKGMLVETVIPISDSRYRLRCDMLGCVGVTENRLYDDLVYARGPGIHKAGNTLPRSAPLPVFSPTRAS
jgi:hypothetical protein